MDYSHHPTGGGAAGALAAGDFLSARDHQEAFLTGRNTLIMALSGCLPRAGGVLSIGLPGNVTLRAFQIARPDLHAVESLSVATLAAWPGFAATMGHCCGIVDQTAGEIVVQEVRPFAGHGLGRASHLRPCSPVARIFAQLERPALVLFGAEAGHGPLISALLPDLARSRALLWWELPVGAAAAELASVLDALKAPGISAYVLTRTRGLCAADKVQPADGPEVLLLVPTDAWDTAGLDRIAGSDAGLFASGRLLRNRAGLGPGAFGHLAGLASHIVPSWPEKMFLEAGTHVFAEGARLIRQDGVALLQTRWQPVARLLVHAPVAGRFRLGIPCYAEPAPALLDALVLEAGPYRVPFDWHAEWWQLRSRQPVICDDPRVPLVLSARLAPGASVAGIDLLLKGIEFQIEERFGAAALPGSVQQGDWQG